MTLPERKANRLPGYDYSQNGAYFVTICTKNRERILCDIVVGDGVLDVPQVRLTNFGQAVKKRIEEMNDTYDFISVDKYVIMPNHIHLIVRIDFPQGGTSRTPSPTNAVIPHFISTLKRFVNQDVGTNIWQRSYHDHIIRDDADYLQIWQYIDENPLKWQDDCFYTEERNERQ